MMRALFVSHGGGPLPLLGDANHMALVHAFEQLRPLISFAPKALVVVSAHWETQGFSVNTAADPGLIYDYSGFEPSAYSLQYRALGEPGLAEVLVRQLAERGVKAQAVSRGFDHGVFVPLSLLFPNADVPVVQISLSAQLSPLEHWQLGQVLGTCLTEEVLVVGSGFSFHNMPLFFQRPTEKELSGIDQFHLWLDRVVCSKMLSTEQRQSAWLNWSAATGARLCHPREEHLLPLLVCAAAAGNKGEKIDFEVMGIEARHYYWR